jgi:hypothetical protein
MMRKKKNTVSVAEVTDLLNTFLQEVEYASRRKGEGGINYPYATGLLSSSIRTLVSLATTGGTATEVRDALKYEIELIHNYAR